MHVPVVQDKGLNGNAKLNGQQLLMREAVPSDRFFRHVATMRAKPQAEINIMEFLTTNCKLFIHLYNFCERMPGPCLLSRQRNERKYLQMSFIGPN